MKEIEDIEEKLKNDPIRLKAYLQYKKYEMMLDMYNNPADRRLLLRNTFNPFKIAQKQTEKKGIDIQEFETFCEIVDSLKAENPNIRLNDISTREGRNVVGDIIAKTQDEDFKVADLNGVAVAKNFMLCKTVEEARGKGDNEIVKILKDNQIPIPIYEKAHENYENYERNNRRELYDKFVKAKTEDIIHITAGVLQIGPGEARSSLEALEQIKGKDNRSDFDRKIDIHYTNEEYKYEHDLIKRSKEKIDIILYDDRLTDHEKSAMIRDEQRIIESAEKTLENVKSKRSNQQKLVVGMDYEINIKKNTNQLGNER